MARETPLPPSWRHDYWKFRNEEKCEKLDLFKPPLTPDFDLLESNSIYSFVHENKKN